MNSATISDSDGEAEPREGDERLVVFHRDRKVAPRGRDHQRRQHDQERERQQRHGGQQRVADQFQPQPVPAAHLDHAVGAVQADAQALDAVGCEVDRQHQADRQHAALRHGQHVVDLAGNGVGDLVGPGVEHQLRGLVGELRRAEEAGERRQHDQEREQRHQRRQRDVACDRPAVIDEEHVEGVHRNAIDVADVFQNGSSRRTAPRIARRIVPQPRERGKMGDLQPSVFTSPAHGSPQGAMLDRTG